MQVDKIYIISLEANNKEEVSKIVNKLGDLGLEGPTDYEIVQGHNGHTLELPVGYNAYSNWNLSSNTNDVWWQRDVTPGECGCAISHYNVWNKILEDGVERALILEDDFKSIKPISGLQYPDVDWDVAYLGRYVFFADEEESIDLNWISPLSSNNTHAYIVTKKAAGILVNDYDFTKNLIPVDDFVSATVTKHRREDIIKLFPPKLVGIATSDDMIVQSRPHEESQTEPYGKNINLDQEDIISTPYFEILDDSNWEEWKLKYINHTLAKGEYDLMIDDLGNNILEFQLFTEKFCKEAVALSETLNKWTVDRHEFYPTNDVLLPELGLDKIYSRVLREVVNPLCIHYWKLEGDSWPSMVSENFLARYTTDRQSHLSLHHDHSHITMVVKLNDEFEGGGTWFPKYNILSNPKRVGTATLHPGMITHLHGARPIHAGKRYICVSFMRQS
jgi:GR25 family glycosyltransferase involved in LPS biosynthesis